MLQEFEIASCHQFTSSNKSNFKLVSKDGKYEVIYDENNKIVTDVRDVGTYNFASPKDDGFNHLKKDILTWIAWGNAESDTTTIPQRMKALIGGGIKDTLKEWGNNISNKANEIWNSICDGWENVWIFA